VVDLMALEGAPELIGIHSNMPGAIPPDIDKAAAAGAPAPAGLCAEEKRAYERLAFSYSAGKGPGAHGFLGYAYQMGLRPQTLYGIADSPVGLAAYLLDHDERSYKLIARAFDGREGDLTRDDVLDNVTHFWFTNTAVSSARLYWENNLPFFATKGVTIPVAVSAFPDELYPTPRSWAEKAYPGLVYYNKHDKGGHFAAWEQPQLLTQDMRAGFRSLR
jgi:hypothetical protein